MISRSQSHRIYDFAKIEYSLILASLVYRCVTHEIIFWIVLQKFNDLQGKMN